MEENQFGRRNVHNATLTPEMVPRPGAAWPEICEFALTFDGYVAVRGNVGEIANSILAGFKKGRPLPSDLTILRAALFFEQRRYAHFGWSPEGSDRAYIDAVLDALLEAVKAQAAGVAQGTDPMIQIDRDLAARLGRETLDILRHGTYVSSSGHQVDLRSALAASVADTIEYGPDSADGGRHARNASTVITVENQTVLEVGRRMAAAGPVAALNFAAATQPGGGFLTGARAQEESIARSSGLFACLERREMYAYHRPRLDAMYSDWVIYSPSVPVFRADAGDLLDEPWPLSILTCPAVNGRALERYEPHRLPQVPTVMAKRTAKVLSVAATHDVRRFILGAWGCGAFGLDAEMMAGVFHEALAGPFRRAFDEIVFAVTDWSPDQRFIGPFRRAFPTEHPSL